MLVRFGPSRVPPLVRRMLAAGAEFALFGDVVRLLRPLDLHFARDDAGGGGSGSILLHDDARLGMTLEHLLNTEKLIAGFALHRTRADLARVSRRFTVVPVDHVLLAQALELV